MSESYSRLNVDGNVANFVITNNVVHDNDSGKYRLQHFGLNNPGEGNQYIDR